MIQSLYQSATSGAVPGGRHSAGFGNPTRHPRNGQPNRTKRVFDVIASGGGLLALLPVLLLIAVVIKLTSRGPVFFRQTRVGYGQQPFQIYKFRSMYLDRCDHSGESQTVEGDDRVTPIGRILRRTSLDELPQLINVVKGDMSLVGPRPHVPGMLAAGVPYEDLVPNYDERHMVRPGLTGLAQVNGLRGPTTDADLAIKRIEKDLEYVRTSDLRSDLRIIVKTLVQEIRGGSGH